MRSYRHDIVSWSEGTQALGADEYRVFHVVVQLIYLAEGPLPFSEKELATRCNMPVTRLRKAIAGLVAGRKIWLRDNRVYSLRVLTELRKLIPDCPEWDLTPVYDVAEPMLPLDAPQKVKGAPRSEVEAIFKRFWDNRAPRTGGDPKEPARKKFMAFLASGVSAETIEAGMKRHIATLRSIGKLGTEFTPMTVTWLNAVGFKDDAPHTEKQNVVTLDPAKMTREDWDRVLRLYRVTNSWKTALHGPEPGRPGCLVPSELIAPKKDVG